MRVNSAAAGNPGSPDIVVTARETACIRPAWKGVPAGFIAAVSTRVRGVSPGELGLNTSFKVGDADGNVRKNREIFFSAAGIDGTRLATAGQVHGAVVTRVEAPGHYELCDALITSAPGLFLGISIADCLPVIIVDPVLRSVGIVHSGWKGSCGKIVLRTLEAMSEHFGTDPANVHAYVGPSAGGCCYEVGEDVASIFPEDVLLGSGRSPGGPVRLDLAAFNRGVLLGAGVPEKQILVSGHCTIHETDLFHSHRRDGSRSGRMLAVVGIVENGQNGDRRPG
jgi:YfiH family protein